MLYLFDKKIIFKNRHWEYEEHFNIKMGRKLDNQSAFVLCKVTKLHLWNQGGNEKKNFLSGRKFRS